MPLLIILLVVILTGVPGTVCANDLTNWMIRQSFELDRDEMPEPDPGSTMREKIHEVADDTGNSDLAVAADTCKFEHSAHQRAYCWTSYGRNLHILLPELAWNFVAVLRPHTLYSYKTVDLRFPPQIRLRLPADAFTVVGYDEELNDYLGWRLRVKF